MEKQPIEYVVTDFEAVNQFITREYNREMERLKDFRNLRRRKMMGALGYLVISIAIACLITAIAYWIYKVANSEPEIKHADAANTATMDKKIIESSDRSNENTSASSNLVPLKSYVIFDTIELDGRSVVTGRRYHPEDPSFPSYQYCYVEKGSKRSSWSSDVDNIADKDREGEVVIRNSTSEVEQLVKERNTEAATVNWQFTAEKARSKLKSHYDRIKS